MDSRSSDVGFILSLSHCLVFLVRTFYSIYTQEYKWDWPIVQTTWHNAGTLYMYLQRSQASLSVVWDQQQKRAGCNQDELGMSLKSMSGISFPAILLFVG